MVAPPQSAATQIPVIDIGPLAQGSMAEKQRVATAIGQACEVIGFFYVTHHGIDPQVIESVFGAARRFFDLPVEKKLQIQATRDHYRGYLPLESKGYAAGKGDLFEAFKMQLDLPPEDPDVRAGKPLHAHNKWPDEQDLPGWRSLLLEYQRQMHGLAAQICRGFAIALSLEEDFFADQFQKPLTQLSLMHYPPQSAETLTSQFGVHPHADTGAFTILTQDTTGGLEVQHRSGEWIVAPPIPGSYLINIGDMMARWTNDRFTSTPHRVINRSTQDRISIPFFVNPDYDAVVTCLPSCCSETDPPRYPAIRAGDYILQVYTSGWQNESEFEQEATTQNVDISLTPLIPWHEGK